MSGSFDRCSRVTRSHVVALFVAFVSAAPAVGCGPIYLESAVAVEEAPPPPRIEVVPAHPEPGHVWVPGHWAWRPSVRRYVWISGRYRRIQHPHHHHWVPGYWNQTPRGWVWVRGRWR